MASPIVGNSQFFSEDGPLVSFRTEDKPTDTVAGGLLLAVLSFNGSPGTITPADGWTLALDGSALSNPKLFVYEKLATSSEPADYTFSWVTAREAGLAITFVGGIPSSSWWNVSPTVVTSTTAGILSLDHGGVTTTEADTLLIGGSCVNSSSRTL